MKGIETGKDKIKKICEAIKSQTIDPAKQQAKEIIEKAKLEAKNILQEAEKIKKELLDKNQDEIEKKNKLSLSSIQSACKQVIDQLKIEIENEFFKNDLFKLITETTVEPKVMAQLITVIIKAIEKEGIDADLSVFISEKIGVDKLDKFLAKDILKKLKEKTVLEANFSGGAKIKLHNKQITIDVSAESLTELVADFIRKDFRDMIFNKAKNE